MATPLPIEEECGTITGTRHPHNGYYAGDFSSLPVREARWVTFPVRRDRQRQGGELR